MASRQEEKEARRQERLAREQKEAAAAARRKRLQLVGGAVLGLAAIAVACSRSPSALGGADDEIEAPAASRPRRRQAPGPADLGLRGRREGRRLHAREPAVRGGRPRGARTFKPSDYKTNPPTSGTHFPEWYDDGIYDAGHDA